jgi:hypothetical protein
MDPTKATELILAHAKPAMTRRNLARKGMPTLTSRAEMLIGNRQ